MGLFDRKQPEAPSETPAPFTAHEVEGGTVLAPTGVAVRPRQAEPGGPTQRYKLLGRNDPELGFIAPPAMSIITEKGEFKIGDELELTLLEHQVLSKNAVLVPVEAL